ncbi:hypothetical protein Hanom_Chr07g00644021 [Helianthus anomalus]
MSQDEKNDFLFSQLEAAADRIQRQTDFIRITRNDQLSQLVEINTLKFTVEQQQTVIGRQQAKIDQLKAENERLKASWDNNLEIVRNRVAVLWDERCKQQELLKKHDHDSEDQGNPDPSAAAQQPPTSTSTQIVAYQPPQVKFAKGTSSSAQGEMQMFESTSYVESDMAGTSNVISSSDIALQVVHPVSGELLEEGELVEDLSYEQKLALEEMKTVDDVVIDQMPIEQETDDTENLEEIVFEGESSKSTDVRAAGTEFDPFDEEWLKKNLDDINEQFNKRDSSEDTTDTFQEWRKSFLSKIEKPTLPEVQVDYMQYIKEKPHGKILSWMFLHDIHCMAIKREHGIQYFNSLLSITSLPFYEVTALTKLKFNSRNGWKDELYKPQFPIYQQIKYTLDPETNTGRYKLIYQPPKVMDKIPLMPMKQKFLGNMQLWCYDSDTHEAVIVFKDQQNFRMLDPMWIVNMSATDINKVFRHDIFYEDEYAHKALLFQRVACLCFYRGIHAGSTWSAKP